MISITLIIFILQFRSQEKAIKESAYQGLMGRYNDLMGNLGGKPEVARILMDSLPGGTSASNEEAAAYSHLLMAYGIIEEAYLLYAKNWIDEENWLQWSAWLEILANSPMFVAMQKATSGTFDKRFENYVIGKLEKKTKKEK